jgi:GT2 family glycosyltransferase
MAKNPKVSILIISYNTKNVLEDCLKSIAKSLKVDHEVIIVDNNSTDGTPEFLKKSKSKNVKVIFNKKNLGFAKANNQASRLAKSDYLLLLNSDTLLADDPVSDLLKILEKDDSISAATCMLKNKDGSIQPTGGAFPLPFPLFVWMMGLSRYYPDSAVHPGADRYFDSKKIDWVTGAFFLVRKDLYIGLGGLSEDYFMYVEELDFCYRASLVGNRCYYYSEKSIIHIGGASSGSQFALQSELLNTLLFYKKNLRSNFGYAKFMILAGVVFRLIGFAILGKGDRYETYAKILPKVWSYS